MHNLKILWIQGLRGIAISLVLLNHFDVKGFKNGYLGVDIFFVLSGFLITNKLFSSAQNMSFKSYLREFYDSRIRRILPLISVSIFVTIFLGWLLNSRIGFSNLLEDSLWALIFGANFRNQEIQLNYFSQGDTFQPLMHFWSLAIEEQFYIAWPILLFALIRLEKILSRRFVSLVGTLLIALILLLVSLLNFATSDSNDYFDSLPRFYELLIGSLTCLIIRCQLNKASFDQRYLGFSVVGIFVISVFSPTIDSLPTSLKVSPVVLSTSLIIIYLTFSQARRVKTLLESKALVFIGNISFSLYVWHWIILSFANFSTQSKLLDKVSLLVFIFIISVCSYHLIEAPFLLKNRKRILPQRNVPVLISTVYACLIFVTFVGYSSQSYLSKTSDRSANKLIENYSEGDFSQYWKLKLEESFKTAESTTIATTSVNDILSEWDGSIQKFLDNPRKGQTKRAYIFGDSLGQRIGPLLYSNLDPSVWYVKVFSNPGCPINYPPSPDYQNPCTKFKMDFLNEIQEVNPDIVLIISDHILMDANVQGEIKISKDAITSLDKTLKIISKNASNVYYVGKFPQMRYPSQECARLKLKIVDCSGDLKIVTSVNEVLTRLSSSNDITYIAPNNIFCHKNYCPIQVDGVALYIDHVHPSDAFANLLARLFLSQLRLDEVPSLLSQ